MVPALFLNILVAYREVGQVLFELVPLVGRIREKRCNKICRLIGCPVSFAAATFGLRPWALMTGEHMTFFRQYILGIAA